MSVKQLGRRLLQIVIVLIGISFFTFILTYLAPGDPVRTRYAASGMVPTEKELQEERERLGLNDPVLVQYGRWLGKVLHGDFGTSYSNGKPVAELLSVRLLPTLKLAFSALILMLLVAVPLGMLSAVYKIQGGLSGKGSDILGSIHSKLLGRTHTSLCCCIEV